MAHTVRRSQRLLKRSAQHDGQDQGDWFEETGKRLKHQFQETRQLQHLEEATRQFELALHATPEKHSSRGQRLGQLGICYIDLFRQKEELEYLDDAVRFLQQAINATPEDDPARIFRLRNLGVVYEEKYRQKGDSEHFEDARIYFQRSLEITPHDHPQRGCLLERLGIIHCLHFRATGREEDIHHSIDYFERALEATPVDDADKASRLYSLGNGYADKFLFLRQPNDLDKAIEYGELALDATLPDDPDRPNTLESLGISLRERFKQTNRLEDLEKAIDLFHQAVDSPGGDNLDLGHRLQSLGQGYISQFQRTGNLEAIKKAIEYSREALRITPKGHLEEGDRLQSLGQSYSLLFQHTGLLHDNQSAEKYLTKALEVTLGNHLERAERFDCVGVVYEHRFFFTGHLGDLRLCMNNFQSALDLTPDQHSDRGRRLECLGFGHLNLGRRTRQQEEVEMAIRLFHQALQETPESHIERGHRLECLGMAHECLHEFKYPERVDLQIAIGYYEESLQATPANHPAKSILLAFLGSVYGKLFRSTLQICDLETAIGYYQRSIEITPRDHFQYGHRLRLLGFSYWDKCQKTNESSEIDPAIEALTAAFHCKSSTLINRLHAGQDLVGIWCQRKRWNRCSEVFDHIFELLPLAIQPTHSREDMEYIVQQLSFFANTSASVLLRANRPPFKAVQALEQCRGMIAGLTMDARSDISLLKEKHPRLWSQYSIYRDEIGKLKQDIELPQRSHERIDYAVKVHRLNSLTESINTLQNTIRKLRGFERFLLPPEERDILELAREGPIVYLNCSVIGCEAFLITGSGIDVLSLPDSVAEDIQKINFACNSRGNGARRDAAILEEDDEFSANGSTETEKVVMQESDAMLLLWNNVVKPIFQRLQILNQKDSDDDLPRVWWLGGGLISRVPFHAAGDHSQGSSDNTLSHAISSYATTLKSLQFIRKRPGSVVGRRKQKLLIVTMPTTPGGYADLQVEKEAKNIQRHSKLKVATTLLRQPGRDQVLQEIRTSSLVHFACHGIVDEVEPANSALLVGDVEEERLTVKDIEAAIHRNAQVAYLSACSTAEMKESDLAHESIHLASAFQLAGFQHVIGTFWGADDDAAVEIASQFYERLLQDGHQRGRSVACALHNAIRSYKDKRSGMSSISKWAPFIHLGP